MTPTEPPATLRDPALASLWQRARQRLDRFGTTRRGRVELPPLPGGPSRLAVKNLIGREPAASIDLREIERGLVGLGVGSDLDSALTNLGHPPSLSAAASREQRQARRDARHTASRLVEAWPEPWADAWIDREVAAGSFSGAGEAEIHDLLDAVRAVLDVVAGRRHLDLVAGRHGPSRTDLAARLFGSAHALDRSEPAGRLVARALSAVADHAPSSPSPSPSSPLSPTLPSRSAGHPALPWEAAGFHTDLVSHPVLTWGLDLRPGSPLADLAVTATRAGLPLPVTQLALREHPLQAVAGRAVVCVENPRLVEAAAELRIDTPVLTTNGNPRRSAVLIVEQLLASGAPVYYHGDFDSPGLAICGRMHELGCRPVAMTAEHYDQLVRRAADLDIDLPGDTSPAEPTPWCDPLEETFNRSRRIIHEELFFLHRLVTATSIEQLGEPLI